MPFAKIDALHTVYEDNGSGLPIVFVPSITGSREWFIYQTRGLSDKYRVICPEIPCARKTSGITIDSLAENLGKFLSAIRLNCAVIVGHGFGGLIAQRFAALNPSRTEALVLISTFIKPPIDDAELLLRAMSPGEIQPASFFTGILERLFGTKKPDETFQPDESIDWLVAHGCRLSKRALSARIKAAMEFNSSGWVGLIQAPTLVIVGGRDNEEFLAAAEELYKKLPDAALEVIEDADHYCFFSRHDLVNSMIDYFLEEKVAKP